MMANVLKLPKIIAGICLNPTSTIGKFELSEKKKIYKQLLDTDLIKSSYVISKEEDDDSDLRMVVRFEKEHGLNIINIGGVRCKFTDDRSDFKNDLYLVCPTFDITYKPKIILFGDNLLQAVLEFDNNPNHRNFMIATFKSLKRFYSYMMNEFYRFSVGDLSDIFIKTLPVVTLHLIAKSPRINVTESMLAKMNLLCFNHNDIPMDDFARYFDVIEYIVQGNINNSSFPTESEQIYIDIIRRFGKGKNKKEAKNIEPTISYSIQE